MYLLIKTLVIIAIIMFIPIPISMRLRYADILEVYIYRFKLNIYHIRNIIKKRKPNIDKCDAKDEAKEVLSELKKYKGLLSIICKIKYKPNLNLRLKVHYGLNDAALTGISYGIISSALANAYEVLTVIFNIKKYDLSVKPEYNKLTFNCDLRCIIFISLAKIIYMVIFFLKALKKSKKINYNLTQSII